MWIAKFQPQNFNAATFVPYIFCTAGCPLLVICYFSRKKLSFGTAFTRIWCTPYSFGPCIKDVASTSTISCILLTSHGQPHFTHRLPPIIWRLLSPFRSLCQNLKRSRLPPRSPQTPPSKMICGGSARVKSIHNTRPLCQLISLHAFVRVVEMQTLADLLRVQIASIEFGLHQHKLTHWAAKRA